MQFQLITPEKLFFSGDIVQVNVPGEEGEFGVLEGHAPFISTLKPGVVRIQTTQGTSHNIVVLGGIAEAIPERCSVLATTALSIDELSKDQLQRDLDAAQLAAQKAIKDDEKSQAEQNILLLQTALAA